MNNNEKIKVLFVCMGNICRSPTAHGVFEDLVRSESLDAHIEVDSAGTHAYHVGESPDKRAQQTARARGIDLSYIRARKVTTKDFAHYDYVLAMDHDNFDILSRHCPSEYKNKLQLFMDFAPQLGQSEVPDPYYGGNRGFDNVFNMVEVASRGLLEDIKKR